MPNSLSENKRGLNTSAVKCKAMKEEEEEPDEPDEVAASWEFTAVQEVLFVSSLRFIYKDPRIMALTKCMGFRKETRPK